MADSNAFQHVTLCWNDRDVVVRHDASRTSVPRNHRLARAPWSSVVGAHVEGSKTPVVRLELCGIAPARRARSPWAIPVRDSYQAQLLMDVVSALAAGPHAVPALVAAPGEPPLPAEPPEPWGAFTLLRRFGVWRLRFNRWAAKGSGSTLVLLVLLVVLTAITVVAMR